MTAPPHHALQPTGGRTAEVRSRDGACAGIAGDATRRPCAAVRVLIVPGLHDSGETHWQTWLQRHYRSAVRVNQEDWSVPDVERWASRIEAALARGPRGPWVAIAHSFGCLALVHALSRGVPDIAAALLVAPADPIKFGAADALPCQPLPVASTLVASRTDPWMPFETAVAWSRIWGSRLVDVGNAGHVNVASGHGPWPLGKQLVECRIRAIHSVRRRDAESLSPSAGT
jgi:uncharacterized protein